MIVVVLLIVVAGVLAAVGYWFGFGHGVTVGLDCRPQRPMLELEARPLPICDHLDGSA